MITQTELSWQQCLQIAWARLYAALGVPGCVGALLVLLSGASGVWVYQMARPLPGNEPVLAPAMVASAPTVAAMKAEVAPPDLPRATEAWQSIKRIRSLVMANGVAWPQAEYRVVPLSDDALSTLDIRTTIKGPYPKVRQLLLKLLDEEPALALRELTLARPSADTPEIEAKIRWSIFLADGWFPTNVKEQP